MRSDWRLFVFGKQEVKISQEQIPTHQKDEKFHSTNVLNIIGNTK